jgi:hypothetical protein
MGRPKGTKNRATIEAEAAQSFKIIRFSAMDQTDPIKYLEGRRLEFLQRLELIADEARANAMPELELKAVAYGIRLTSLFKSRVDVTASNLGLITPPRLGAMSSEQLKEIENANDESLSAIAETIIKEQ